MSCLLEIFLFVKFWGDVYFQTFHQPVRSPNLPVVGVPVSVEMGLHWISVFAWRLWTQKSHEALNPRLKWIAVKTWPSTLTLATSNLAFAADFGFHQGHWYLSAPLLGCWRAGLVVDFPSELAARHGSNCGDSIMSGDARHPKLPVTLVCGMFT